MILAYVQGSGIGPCMYIVYALDLKPISPANVLSLIHISEPTRPY